MEEPLVIVEKEGHCATVTLNQPETLNALTYEMLQDFKRAVEDIGSDGEVRAVILTGAGRGFCSGANVHGGSGQTLAGGGMGLRRPVREMNRVLVHIGEMEKPWLAAVNGPAVGGGCSLALTCDLVLMAESAYLSVGYVNVGLVLDMGASFLLPRLVGIHKASEFAFLGERISALEAQKLGMVNEAVPDGDLMAKAKAMAARLAGGPTLAIGAMKALLRQAQHGTIGDALEREVNMLSLIAQTEDAAEGLMAFFQKRGPEFKGK
jgi:2-(1,2-epoxy-1,2-dihydrophenyl)acetyl-CoA isomerase